MFFQFWFTTNVIPYQGDNYIIIQISKFLEVKLQFLFFGTHVLRNLFLKIFPLFGQILITGLQFFRALYCYRVFLPHIAKRCTGDEVGEKNEISCRYLCGTTLLVIVIDKSFSVSNLLFKYRNIFSLFVG